MKFPLKTLAAVGGLTAMTLAAGSLATASTSLAQADNSVTTPTIQYVSDGDGSKRQGMRNGKRRGGGVLASYCSDAGVERRMETRAKIQSELDLTAEQAALYQALVAQSDQVAANLAPTCEKIEAARAEASKDRSERRAMRGEIRDEVRAATDGLREKNQAFLASLTDEQREELRELMPRRGKGEGRGKRGSGSKTY